MLGEPLQSIDSGCCLSGIVDKPRDVVSSQEHHDFMAGIEDASDKSQQRRRRLVLVVSRPFCFKRREVAHEGRTHATVVVSEKCAGAKDFLL